jgi:transketolase
MISWQDYSQAPHQNIRDGFGQALKDLGKINTKVVGVCADLRDSIRMQEFAQAYPDRFFEVGVAEQNLIGVSAGLAHEGLTVFAGSYAAFSPGRTHDQIRVSVCYSQENVKIVGGHAGLSVGADGATHQALEDIALMRVLPNMTVLVPSDYQSAYELTRAAAEMAGPVYLRLSRVASRTVPVTEPYQIGKGQLLRTGADVTLVATGLMVDKAFEAAQRLATDHSIEAEVINLTTIKPLDTEILAKSLAKTKLLVSIEEHQVAGGLGSAVAEWSIQSQPVPMKIIGVQDEFGQSGSPEELFDHYGLSTQRIVSQITRWLETRRP